MRNFVVFFNGLLLSLLCISTISIGQNNYNNISFDSVAHKLDEVDVIETLNSRVLKGVAGSIVVLSGEQLRISDVIPNNDFYNSLPGVFMHTGTQNTNRLVIRGIGSRTPYGSNRIKAYYNEIPITTGDGVSFIEDINLEQINKLELLKGPSSALYGSGLGGVLRYTAGNVNTGYQLGYRKGAYGYDEFSFNGNIASKSFQSSLFLFNRNSVGFRQNSSFDKTGFSLVNKWSLKKLSINITALGISNYALIPSSIKKSDYDKNPEIAASNWLLSKGYEENKRFIVGTTTEYRINKNFTNSTTIFLGRNKAFEHRPFNDLDEFLLSYGLRNQLRYVKNKTTLIAGVELFNEENNWSISKQDSFKFDLLSYFSEIRQYINYSILFQYELSIKLSLSGGLNVNSLKYKTTDKLVIGNSDPLHYNYPLLFSPRLGLNYDIDRQLVFYASVGHGFSAPSLEETLMPEGERNYKLKPEMGWMYELGFRFADKKKWNSDLGFYLIDLSNLLVTKRLDEESFIGLNAGQTIHYGVEIMGDVLLFRNKTFPGTLSLNYSATVSKNIFSKFIDDGIDYSSKNLPGIPAELITVSLKWMPSKTINLNLFNQFAGKQYLNDSNTLHEKGYTIFNINSIIKVFDSSRLYITLTSEVNNLLNTKYASMYLVNATSIAGAPPRFYYPGMPRNYKFGIKINIL